MGWPGASAPAIPDLTPVRELRVIERGNGDEMQRATFVRQGLAPLCLPPLAVIRLRTEGASVCSLAATRPKKAPYLFRTQDRTDRTHRLELHATIRPI